MKKLITFLIIATANISLFAQNQNISNGFVFDGEPFIAVNPANSHHLVVAWMGYHLSNHIVIKTRVSFDGGISWSAINFIPHTNPLFSSADPSLEFDNSGNVFLCYIDFSVSVDSGSVYVRKSTDGGLTWGNPVEVINAHSDPGKYPIDRPWIAIDRSGGINDGNIYVTTMPPNVWGPLPPPYHPYFIRSVDGGTSFEPWRYLDTTGWLAGSLIQQPAPFSTISSSGVFYAVYPSYVFSQNVNPQFIFASSNNAGNSFSYSSIVLPSEILNYADTLSKKGYPLCADPSNPNHLVFFNLITPHGDPDIYMWESYDGGITWSDSIRVNDDPIGNNRIQDLVWADFDTDGDLVVTWRDRRNAPDTTYTTASEIWAAVRYKDSLNFSPNFVLSDTIVDYDSVLSLRGNDFMCVKLRNDTLYSVWGDTRTGKLNIWFQRMSLSGQLVSSFLLSSEDFPMIKIFPNPFNASTTIQLNTALNNATIVIYNGLGQIVNQTENISGKTVTLQRDNLPSGLYFIQLKEGNRIICNKTITIAD